jgi:RNase P/RNase MRP subunit p29
MKSIQPLLAVFALGFAHHVFAAENLEPGLLGEYFDLGSSLEDFPTIPADKKPVVKRVDKTINFESTQEGFHGTQLVDFFYIRWTGKIRIPKDGNYLFILESDDGSRLFIDGKQVIDHNGLHAMEEKSGEAGLKSGDHDIKIEFFENDVDAGCKFLWQPPGAAREIVPVTALVHQAATPPAQAGLQGEYFDIGETLDDFATIPADKKPVVKRVDKTINFESTQEAFPGTQLVDFFYIRWTGNLRVPKDGKYTFFLESDDGSRLFIDGKQIIANGGRHHMTEKSGDVELTAGQHSIKVEYFENEVDAGCIFSWKTAAGAKEIVPSAVLSP